MTRRLFRIVPLVLLGTALAQIHPLGAQTVIPNDEGCEGDRGDSQSE